MALIDSMTPDERSRPEILNGSRKKRVAKGSGRSVQELNQLLKQFAQMKKMMKQVQAARAGGRRASGSLSWGGRLYCRFHRPRSRRGEGSCSRFD